MRSGEREEGGGKEGGKGVWNCCSPLVDFCHLCMDARERRS